MPEPFAIATGCFALVTGIGKLVLDIRSFVSQVRNARKDMEAVLRELSSLSLCLEALSDDSEKVEYPESMRLSLGGVIQNCDRITQEMQALLKKWMSGNAGRKLQWADTGRDEINKLRVSLEAHKLAIDIALDVVSILLIADVKQDTTTIKAETTAIKQDTVQISSLVHEIGFLRLQVSRLEQRGGTGGVLLERFLAESTSYAESASDPMELEIPDTTLSIPNRIQERTAGSPRSSGEGDHSEVFDVGAADGDHGLVPNQASDPCHTSKSPDTLWPQDYENTDIMSTTQPSFQVASGMDWKVKRNAESQVTEPETSQCCNNRKMQSERNIHIEMSDRNYQTQTLTDTIYASLSCSRLSSLPTSEATASPRQVNSKPHHPPNLGPREGLKRGKQRLYPDNVAVQATASVRKSLPITQRKQVDQELLALVGFSGLHVLEEGHCARVREVLDSGADVNATNVFGSTLYRAYSLYTSSGSPDMLQTVELLLRRGASVDQSQLLHSAAEYGDSEAMELALDYGANIEALNPSKKTALCVAARCFPPATRLRVVKNMSMKPTVLILLEYGADPNTPGVLQDACFAGNLVLVELLLTHGASPTLKSGKRGSALDAVRTCLLQLESIAKLTGSHESTWPARYRNLRTILQHLEKHAVDK